jgi:hypothetical protein
MFLSPLHTRRVHAHALWWFFWEKNSLQSPGEPLSFGVEGHLRGIGVSEVHLNGGVREHL